MSEDTPRTTWLFRGLRTLMLGLLACTAAMAIAYGTVRYITRGHTPPGVPSQDLMSAPERRITELAAEVGELADQYAALLPLDVGGYSPDAEDWVRNTFRPAVASLRASLADPLIQDHPALDPVRTALDQAHYLGQHPGDLALRKQSIAIMRNASQQAWSILRKDTM